MQQQQNKLTPLGVIFSVLMILGLLGVGAYVVMNKGSSGKPGQGTSALGPGTNQSNNTPGNQPNNQPPAAPDTNLKDLKLITPEPVPSLAAPATYIPKDNIVDIELSEYAGYAGIIAANGGLNPSPDSVFAKKHGFQVRIKLAEDEAWNRLNSGQIGATATTADVMAVFGRQFAAVVPIQIGFSRGADGLIVAKDIRRVNDLKGKVVVTTQYNEAEFFIRFLAQESGASVAVLDDLAATPKPDAINLVFAEDGEGAGEVFKKDITSANPKLAGCVTWDPTTTEVVEASGGKAKLLVTNRNLLIIADVLAVNRGFAEQNPKIIAGLVDGILEGNRMVRDNPATALPPVSAAFKWDSATTKREMAKIHLSNLPENLAFFSGAIDMAGSFGGIYQSSVLAYGGEIITNPVSAERFPALDALKALDATGQFKDEKIVIAPIKSEGSTGLESDPLLSKDIRFLFDPNSPVLKADAKDNVDNLDAIKKLLQISPGSKVLLRGHVDNARIEEFRRQGGEQMVRKNALEAMSLSQKRADEVRRILIEKHGIAKERIETVGRGWEEPAGTDMDKNRRVEVYWYTLE